MDRLDQLAVDYLSAQAKRAAKALLRTYHNEGLTTRLFVYHRHKSKIHVERQQLLNSTRGSCLAVWLAG